MRCARSPEAPNSTKVKGSATRSVSAAAPCDRSSGIMLLLIVHPFRYLRKPGGLHSEFVAQCGNHLRTKAVLLPRTKAHLERKRQNVVLTLPIDSLVALAAARRIVPSRCEDRFVVRGRDERRVALHVRTSTSVPHSMLTPICRNISFIARHVSDGSQICSTGICSTSASMSTTTPLLAFG